MTLDYYTTGERYRRAGWIPCLAGHLDFCLMTAALRGGFNGSGKFDQHSQTINYPRTGGDDRHNRRIVLQSWVDWRDHSDLDGEFRVIVIAECCESADLDQRTCSGHALLLPRAYKRKYPDAHKEIMDLIGALDKECKGYYTLNESQRQQTGVWDDVRHKMNELFEKLQDKITPPTPFDKTDAKCCFHADFRILANGIVVLEYAPIDNDSADEESKYLSLRHIYYYLKYSLHKHKHHHQSADSLTTIVPFSDERKPFVGLLLLGQLKRELVRILRAREKTKNDDPSEALGILGYMESLVATCRSSGLLDDVKAARELAYIHGMQESTKVFLDGLHQAQTEKSQFNTGRVQLTAAITAILSLILLTWLRINQPAVPIDNVESAYSSALVRLFLLDWYMLLPILGLLVVLLWFATGWMQKSISAHDFDATRLKGIHFKRKFELVIEFGWPIALAIAGLGVAIFVLYC